MIRELVSYYDRLAAGDAPDLPLMGYSRQKISFCIVLKPDGALHSFAPEEVQEGKRTFAKVMTVPGQSKPSGSGINPGFLWDNLAYMLGFKLDDPKPDRTSQAFEAFRNRHLDLESQIDDPAYIAFCRFLRDWKPGNAADHPELSTMAAGFGVVKLVGETEYLHERAAVRAWWTAHGAATVDDAGESMRAPSLTDGDPHPIARLHEPKIKGVIGAQTAGAALVSFNLSAFESYGKTQSFNAPVSVTDAFKYCTALNRLTTDRDRRVVLGDTTVVYWSEQPTELESVFAYLCEPVATEDPETQQRLGRFFDRVRRLAPAAEMSEDGVPFYVLGLAPNAARISVRFWMKGTVRTFAERLGRHFADMQIDRAEDEPPLTLQRILDETARDRDGISPLLGGEVVRAVLEGGRYPNTLCNSVIRRICIDGRATPNRISILKAWLLRETRYLRKMEDITVSLDPENESNAYQLGRLFAVLEKTQEEASAPRKLNRTIKDSFFGQASSNPVAVFPRVLKLHAHHLRNISNAGRRVNLEKLVQEIMSRIIAKRTFPASLPLAEQGRFFVGYYHQRLSLFTKSDSTETVTEESN